MFDIASQQHLPVLGCYTATAMKLITINEDQFESVATASSDKPVGTVKFKEDFIAKYPMVFNSPVGTLEGPVDIQVDPRSLHQLFGVGSLGGQICGADCSNQLGRFPSH